MRCAALWCGVAVVLLCCVVFCFVPLCFVLCCGGVYSVVFALCCSVVWCCSGAVMLCGVLFCYVMLLCRDVSCTSDVLCGSGARFSKAAKLFGPISNDIIFYLS